MTELLKWKDYPGFYDPDAVVQYCVSILSRDVYPNMELGKFDLECNKAKLKEPCEGIKLYLSELEIFPDIIEEVAYYAKNPCHDEMVRVIANSGPRALAFMLEYLRLRGAFINWEVNSSDSSVYSITNSRCIIRYASSYMENLPELDYCACVTLGKYLYYLLTVCYGHEMYFMKDVLSKLYGPIFVQLNLSDDMKHRLTNSKCIDYSIAIFRQMLESCPWYRYSPREVLKRTMYPSKKSEFIHKYTEMADYIKEKSTIPLEYRENLAENLHKNRLDCPDQYIPTNVTVKERCQQQDESDLTIPKIEVPVDNCKINYGTGSMRVN